jgi:predicted metalloprotease with PDZ domain
MYQPTRILFFAALVSFATIPAAAQQAAIPAGLSYHVDLTAADTHYINVTLTATATGPETDLVMATWTPGSYLVREYAKHVDSVMAEAAGRELPVVKTTKNRWRVHTGKAGTFQFRYRVFCKEVSVRTNFCDNTHAVLNGAATFVTVPEQMDHPHRVELQLPQAWNGSASSMRVVNDNPNHYAAADFDELVDSPVVAGLVDVYPFEVAGVPHYLVNVNDEGNWDGPRATRDLARMVQAHHDMWGCVPYDRYFFLNVINDSGGGLEHDYCCLMMSRQRAARNERSYQRWLGLCSHEFFHTWNVRRLRPRSLAEYDYESEAYTPSLWIAEGITSYYEDLLLVRAGLLDSRAFVGLLSRQVAGVQNREGRKVQSLRDSSHDAWIKFYRPEENSRQTQVSYYNKGAVAGFLLDVEIRKASAGRHSLDDALRLMYERYANGTGYTSDDFRSVCSEVAGCDLTAWFQSAIDSTNELDFQNAADWLGLQIGCIMPANADPSESPRPKQLPWIGLGEEGSPASEAGLQDDDEVLAINGKRFKGKLQERIEKSAIGEELNLLVSRRNRIQEIALTVGSREIPVPWNVRIWDNAPVRQRVNRHDWLDPPLQESTLHQSPQQPAIYKWTKFVPRPVKPPLQ